METLIGVPLLGQLFPSYDLALDYDLEQLRNARKRSVASDLYLPAGTGP